MFIFSASLSLPLPLPLPLSIGFIFKFQELILSQLHLLQNISSQHVAFCSVFCYTKVSHFYTVKSSDHFSMFCALVVVFKNFFPSYLEIMKILYHFFSKKYLLITFKSSNNLEYIFVYGVRWFFVNLQTYETEPLSTRQTEDTWIVRVQTIRLEDTKGITWTQCPTTPHVPRTHSTSGALSWLPGQSVPSTQVWKRSSFWKGMPWLVCNTSNISIKNHFKCFTL